MTFRLMLPLLLALASAPERADADDPPEVDTALAVAVDVSQSVDRERYTLQMEGIARALETPEVVNAITSGRRAVILFSVIVWSDAPVIVVPWQKIGSAGDAARVAAMVRAVPHQGGEFTCLARMLRNFADSVLPVLPARAQRVIVDVSGDGIDNCSIRTSIDEQRDRLIAAGVTINGLPILVPGENDTVGEGAYRAPGFGFGPVGPGSDATTLDAYFKDHVIGGAGAFILPAQGYADFGRAITRKFVTEISSR
jgi:hypothetical protein